LYSTPDGRYLWLIVKKNNPQKQKAMKANMLSKSLGGAIALILIAVLTTYAAEPITSPPAKNIQDLLCNHIQYPEKP